MVRLTNHVDRFAAALKDDFPELFNVLQKASPGSKISIGRIENSSSDILDILLEQGYLEQTCKGYYFLYPTAQLITSCKEMAASWRAKI
ncbi:MAG: hypothetical protein EB060_01245 [Proteobacteria bacterium]|nr:hypothetical protein [Pseudomonadota bacterium]